MKEQRPTHKFRQKLFEQKQMEVALATILNLKRWIVENLCLLLFDILVHSIHELNLLHTKDPPQPMNKKYL